MEKNLTGTQSSVAHQATPLICNGTAIIESNKHS